MYSLMRPCPLSGGLQETSTVPSSPLSQDSCRFLGGSGTAGDTNKHTPSLFKMQRCLCLLDKAQLIVYCVFSPVSDNSKYIMKAAYSVKVAATSVTEHTFTSIQ